MLAASRTAAFRTAISHLRLAAPAASLVVRGMADIAVEHGRGQWKTYGDLSSYKPGKFQIQCFNKISPVGLARFPEDIYDVRTDGEDAPNAHAILLRSHKLQKEEVAHTVRAIARCVHFCYE
jgi:D-3-phosphoglycerate dehydrogenase